MAFRMQAPWKNPRSENLWFRRRVPSNLVGYMGKREIKFSLGTADPVLAKIRFRAARDYDVLEREGKRRDQRQSSIRIGSLRTRLPMAS